MTRDRAGRVLGTGLPALWLVLVVAVDVAVAGDSVVLIPLFALAPLMACAVLPAGTTAAYAVVALSLAVAAGWWDDTWGTAQQAVRIVDVALIGLAAVVIAAVRVRRERRYARMVIIAEVAQRTILPTLPAHVGAVSVGARYLSAARDAFVGGDLYDCYHAEGCVRFLVGDVRGKGIGAVEQAARVIRAFRQAAATRPDLPAVAAHMSAYLTPFFDDEEFVTALLVDASDRSALTLVSCGHPPPLLLSADGEGRLPEPPAGLPLGLGESYDALVVPWGQGDRLLMYTDGLSEARDRDGRFLPVLSLAPVVVAGTVDAALDSLLEAVRTHVPKGRLADDLAVVLLENLWVERYRSSSGSAEAASGVSSRGPSAEPAVVWGDGRSSPRSAGASGTFPLMESSRIPGERTGTTYPAGARSVLHSDAVIGRRA